MLFNDFDRSIIPVGPSSGARFRLICFPHAGGGPRYFKDWHLGFPTEVEILAVQLPGREGRFLERPFDRFDVIVDSIVDSLANLRRAPLAFFGHSMGALIAFEVARALRRYGMGAPAHLFVSSRPGPRIRQGKESIHSLPDLELAAKLREFGGTSELTLSDEEALSLFLPTLRADLAACATYLYRADAPLKCPISAYGGVADFEVSRDCLNAWSAETSQAFNLHMFPGGHFYLGESTHDVLRAISEDLATTRVPN